jgi:large subunit ribosomal protein L13
VRARYKEKAVMKTHSTKPSEVQREWWLVDADGVVLGRLASEVAKRLRGKHKPYFAPHLDTGDHVVVINAAKVVVTGGKLLQKQYYRHSGYPGGLRARPYSRFMVDHPERAIEKAVRGMLPRNRLGRAMLKKLKVYAGPDHPHTAQSPKPLDLKKVAAPHDPEQAHTIQEVTGG